MTPPVVGGAGGGPGGAPVSPGAEGRQVIVTLVAGSKQTILFDKRV